MRRNPLLLPALLCLALIGAVAPACAGAYTLGISDENPGTFQSAYYKRLHLHTARLGVPWDTAITADQTWLNFTRTWLAAARAAHASPLVSFGRDTSHVPTVNEYGRAIRAFRRAFPQVRTFTAWNEPDWVYLSLGHRPKLAAQYFNVLAASCRGCTLVAGDFYLPPAQLRPYLKAYQKALKVKPSGWALHNYYDIREHNYQQVQMLTKMTHGPIWLDEISGVLRRGHWQFANQSDRWAAVDEHFLLFKLARRFPRVTHIFHYQWQGAAVAPWDSGLLDDFGNPRPAYYQFASAAGHPLKGKLRGGGSGGGSGGSGSGGSGSGSGGSGGGSGSGSCLPKPLPCLG